MSTTVLSRRGLSRSEFHRTTEQTGSEPSYHDGPLGLQVFLQNRIAQHREDVNLICTLPERAPWDYGVWQLEQLRQVVLELSDLLVALAPECTASNCGQMKATDEWVFLCAAHRNPRECCAIDYIIHNLEATTAVLNSRRWFPNRGSVPDTAEKMFQSIARRLYRIFAHVYYHHPHIFSEFEASRHLYKRFMHLTQAFDWMEDKLWIIPASALSASEDGSSTDEEAAGGASVMVAPEPLMEPSDPA